MEAVRCYTCNKVLDHFTFQEVSRTSVRDAFVTVGAVRFCCKRMFLAHPEELESIVRRYPLRDTVQPNFEFTFTMRNERCVSTD